MAKELMARAIQDQCAAQLENFEAWVEGDAEAFDALELYRVLDIRDNLVRLEVLACCGGPTVWLRVYPDGKVYANGTWGSASGSDARHIDGAMESLGF